MKAFRVSVTLFSFPQLNHLVTDQLVRSGVPAVGISVRAPVVCLLFFKCYDSLLGKKTTMGGVEELGNCHRINVEAFIGACMSLGSALNHLSLLPLQHDVK